MSSSDSERGEPAEPADLAESAERAVMTPTDLARLKELLPKYVAALPRYTSYPTAPVWQPGGESGFDDARFAAELRAIRDDVSLYVHVPFCRSLCHFCACNRVITRDEAIVERYLDALAREVAMTRREVEGSVGAAQLHLGGGTPTHLTPEQLRALVRGINDAFPIRPDAEVSIEVDPRVTTDEHVLAISQCGFDRVSLGVQDFDPKVQQAIHREQSVEMTRSLVSGFRSSGISSVAFDLIYGLPFQTPDSFHRTLDSVVDIAPDRIALYSYAHVTWVAKQQRGFQRMDLPSPEEKLELFGIALERLLGAGYEYLGLDHFALPGDAIARAHQRGALHRNFMGHTTRPDLAMIGFGPSAISGFPRGYAQNRREVPEWAEATLAGRFATQRGWQLSDDDVERRFVISRLLCQSAVDAREFTERFGRRFANRFSEELVRLSSFEEDGLLRLEADGSIRLSMVGRVLARNVASVFDAYLERPDAPGEAEKPARFSQSDLAVGRPRARAAWRHGWIPPAGHPASRYRRSASHAALAVACGMQWTRVKRTAVRWRPARDPISILPVRRCRARRGDTTLVEYSPLMPEILEDPFPIYKQLRDEAPAYYCEEFDCWALSRFQDIWEQASDNDSYSAAARGTTPAHLITKQLEVFPSVNMMDPPEHVRNRALISGAFKPKRVQELVPVVEEIVERHAKVLDTDAEVDLAVDYIGRSRWRCRARCSACPSRTARRSTAT